MARQLHSVIGGRYLAGLWGNDLLDELCWQVDQLTLTPRLRIYRSPSWSWAAVDSTIYRSASFAQPGKGQDHLEVLECVSVLASPDPYGAVLAAHLRLRGKFIIGILKISEQTGSRLLVLIRILEQEDTFFPDYQLERLGRRYKLHDTTVYCLPVRSDPEWVYLLVLRPVLNVENTFERIGSVTLLCSGFSDLPSFENGVWAPGTNSLQEFTLV